MDKETLSNYGWVVICVLVLAVLMALATPFGGFVASAVENTTESLFNASRKAVNTGLADFGVVMKGQEMGEVATLNGASGKKIPKGGVYTQYINFTDGVKGGKYYYKYDDVIVLTEGNYFPDEPSRGDAYKYGDYEYCYGFETCYCAVGANAPNFSVCECDKWVYECGCEGEEIEGWSVRYTGKDNPGTVLETICDQPIVSMSGAFKHNKSLTNLNNLVIPETVDMMQYTFANCTSLKNVEIVLPNNMYNISGMFYGCTGLTDMSNFVIPNTVRGTAWTFAHCKNLTKSPILPNNLIDMTGCFSYCELITEAPQIPGKVKILNYAFAYCTALEKAPALPDTAQMVGRMFDGCANLTTAPVLPSKASFMMGMFQDCVNLKTYIGSTDADGDFSNYILPESDCAAMFAGCTNLITAPVIPEGTENIQYMFKGCTSLTGTVIINMQLNEDKQFMESGAFEDTIKNIVLKGTCTKLDTIAATANNGNVIVEK